MAPDLHASKWPKELARGKSDSRNWLTSILCDYKLSYKIQDRVIQTLCGYRNRFKNNGRGRDLRDLWSVLERPIPITEIRISF